MSVHFVCNGACCLYSGVLGAAACPCECHAMTTVEASERVALSDEAIVRLWTEIKRLKAENAGLVETLEKAREFICDASCQRILMAHSVLCASTSAALDKAKEGKP